MNYELVRTLPKGKNKKVIGVRKGKIKKAKRKLKFQNSSSCLKATQLENKINHLEKNKIITDVLKSHKQFIRNNNSILKTQQRFKSERHNVFTEEINKIALNSNDDKKMQSIDSIETYTCGTSKGLLSEKEGIKCNNLIK